MAENVTIIPRGKLFFEKYNVADGTYAAAIEIANNKSIKLEETKETKKIPNKTENLSTTAEERVTANDAKITFESHNIDDNTMELATGNAVETTVYAIGDNLPDGTVAAVETTVKSFDGGGTVLLEGRFKFVETVQNKRRRVIEIPHAIVKSTGGFELLGDEFTTLNFEGELKKLDGVALYKTHFIPVA